MPKEKQKVVGPIIDCHNRLLQREDTTSLSRIYEIEIHPKPEFNTWKEIM